MIIAIDGPAASGKSSLAHLIAQHFDLPHMNTGALYRAVARDVLRRGQSPGDADAAASAARNLDENSLRDAALSGHDLAEPASIVAAIPEVRQALLAFQRDYIAKARAARGAVIEGRDIGTVICPDADRKLFITASVEERARRRYLEMAAKGGNADAAVIMADLQQRDDRDRGRSAAPLTQAADAYLLDTTKLDIQSALQAAVDYISTGKRF